MTTLQDQIATMLENGGDYVVSPVGINTDTHAVVAHEGEAWLALHNDSANMDDFTLIGVIS